MAHNYSLSTKKNAQILRVRNLLSEYENKEILRVALTEMAGGPPNYVVDLSATEMMNSVGINFLITLKKRSNVLGGKIALAGASVKIIKLLEITKLIPMFYLADSVDEAVQLF